MDDNGTNCLIYATDSITELGLITLAEAPMYGDYIHIENRKYVVDQREWDTNESTNVDVLIYVEQVRS